MHLSGSFSVLSSFVHPYVHLWGSFSVFYSLVHPDVHIWGSLAYFPHSCTHTCISAMHLVTKKLTHKWRTMSQNSVFAYTYVWTAPFITQNNTRKKKKGAITTWCWNRWRSLHYQFPNYEYGRYNRPQLTFFISVLCTLNTHRVKIVSVALVTDFNIMSQCDCKKCPQFTIRVSPRMGTALMLLRVLIWVHFPIFLYTSSC